MCLQSLPEDIYAEDFNDDGQDEKAAQAPTGGTFTHPRSYSTERAPPSSQGPGRYKKRLSIHCDYIDYTSVLKLNKENMFIYVRNINYDPEEKRCLVCSEHCHCQFKDPTKMHRPGLSLHTSLIDNHKFVVYLPLNFEEVKPIFLSLTTIFLNVFRANKYKSVT